MWDFIVGVLILAIGFVAGLLVGRKNPKLADKVHAEGKKLREKV